LPARSSEVIRESLRLLRAHHELTGHQRKQLRRDLAAGLAQAGNLAPLAAQQMLTQLRQERTRQGAYMLPVLRTTQAAADLVAILTYLDEHSPAAADRLVAAIDQHCTSLGQFPGTGRARDDIMLGLCSVVVDRYVLLYRVRPQAVEVLRILPGGRDLASILQADTNR